MAMTRTGSGYFSSKPARTPGGCLALGRGDEGADIADLAALLGVKRCAVEEDGGLFVFVEAAGAGGLVLGGPAEDGAFGGEGVIFVRVVGAGKARKIDGDLGVGFAALAGDFY